MPRIANIQGVGRLTFPDEFTDEQMDAEVERHLAGRSGAQGSPTGTRLTAAQMTQPGAAPQPPRSPFLGKTGLNMVPQSGVGVEEMQEAAPEAEVPYSALRMVAPTAGALIGGALGAGVASPYLAAGGAAAGEGVNRAARALAFPEDRGTLKEAGGAMGKEALYTLGGAAVGKMLPSAIRTVGKFFPGSWRAQQKLAVEGMERIPGLINAPSSKVAGGKLERFLTDIEGAGEPIQLSATASKADKLFREGDKMQALHSYFLNTGQDRLAAVVKSLSQKPVKILSPEGEAQGFTYSVRSLPVDDMQRLMHAVGELTQDAPEPARQAASALFKALTVDLKLAARQGGEQAQNLLDLRNTYMRSKAKEAIGEQVRKKGVGAAPESAQEASQQITKPTAFHEVLMREDTEAGRRFAQLSPREQADIQAAVERASQYARPTGESWGRYAHPFAWLLGGSVLGGMTGGPQGSMIGGTVGIGAEKLLERVARSPMGRRWIRAMIEAKLPHAEPISTLGGAAIGTLTGP